MKRRPPTLLILLLLVGGAIVNVAVAWGCRFRSYSGGMTSTVSSPEVFTATWKRLARPGWIAEPFRGHQSSGLGVSVASAHAGQWQTTLANGSQVSLPRYATEENRAGWPMLATRNVFWIDNAQDQITTSGNVRLSIAPNKHRRDADLPIRPLWPGFAINTLFYAAILWLLFVGPFALRRRRRIKRGLCVKCAYPVGTSDKCTECGAAVPVLNAA